MVRQAQKKQSCWLIPVQLCRICVSYLNLSQTSLSNSCRNPKDSSSQPRPEGVVEPAVSANSSTGELTASISRSSSFTAFDEEGLNRFHSTRNSQGPYHEPNPHNNYSTHSFEPERHDSRSFYQTDRRESQPAYQVDRRESQLYQTDNNQTPYQAPYQPDRSSYALERRGSHSPYTLDRSRSQTSFDPRSGSQASFQPDRRDSFDPRAGSQPDRRDSYYAYEGYDNGPNRHNSSARSFVQEPDLNETGPPPVPPPHSVSLSNIKRDNSHDSMNSLTNRKGILSDRTPSPLRHAMNDVMSSLDKMKLTGVNPPVESFDTPTRMRPSDPRNSQYRSHQNDNREPRPGITRNHSTFSNLSDFSNSEYERKTYNRSPHADVPFDPNSYNSPSASPTRQDSYNVNIFRTTSYNSVDQDVSRADTYKSLSSVTTNQQSLFSEGSAPTEVSNSSTSSAGSTANTRNEIYYKMEGVPGLSNSIAHSNETPVTLPTARHQRKSPTNSPQRSIPIKKSAGFLKKFFSTAAGNYNAPSQNTEKRSFGRKSFEWTERASSSLSLRGTMNKTSGKSYSGRTALTSQDLYPTQSPLAGSNGEQEKWIEIHRNVHRTNTLTQKEREQRNTRPQIDGMRPLQPIDDISRIAGNETGDGGFTWNDRVLKLDSHDFSAVQNNIYNLNSWPYVTPGELARGHIIQKFSDPLDQLRAAFDFCSTKLKWESLVGTDDTQEEGVGSLARIMQTRRASCLDVAHAFKQMCDALSIHCEVISGYLKGPGEVWHNPGIPRPNHHWNAVVVEGLWRMVDASLASPSFPTRDIYSKCDKRTPEWFYFLTRPCDLVFTHVPYDLRDEHIVPALSHEILIALPLAGPLAFEYNLQLQNFSTCLTRLQGLDVAELIVAVPPEAELFAEVMVGTFPAGSAHLLLNTDDRKKAPALSQVFWKNKERFYRVKAVLPPTHNQGALNLYVGPRGTLQSITKNTLSLAYSVPMMQKDENPILNFVIRHPTPHSIHQDIYINEPQCRDLVYGQSYVFSVSQHPGQANTRATGKVKMAIQTPLGRIVKLYKTEGGSKSYGVWQGNVKCIDTGTWRGLILSDTGNAWSVYAEWHCF